MVWAQAPGRSVGQADGLARLIANSNVSKFIAISLLVQIYFVIAGLGAPLQLRQEPRRMNPETIVNGLPENIA